MIIKKKYFYIFTILLVLLLLIVGKNFLENYNSEFSIIKANWKINLSEKPIEEVSILDETSGFSGEGQKIIKFKYNYKQIENIEKDFEWIEYNNRLDIKFNEFESLISKKNIYYTVKPIKNVNKFFLIENNSKFLILALNLNTNELIAFINY